MAAPPGPRGGWFSAEVTAQHPDAEARLLDELRTVLAGRAPTVDDLARLTYAGMVVAESLRLFPPAYGIGRQAIRATELAGYPLARKDIVIAPTWVVQRDPRWFDKPGDFQPERWAADLARRLPRFAYFPFGGGPRQCIGNATLILAAIVQRVRLELLPGPRVTPTAYVTLRPEPGIRVRVTRR